MGQVERSLRAENQLDSSSRFDTIPACDRRTYRRTDKHDDSKFRASIASRGKDLKLNLRKTKN